MESSKIGAAIEALDKAIATNPKGLSGPRRRNRTNGLP